MKNIILGIILLLLAYHSKSQDVNSSHFYSVPSNINPAFTGFFNNDYFVAATYKNQWSSISAPFQTVGATAQMSFLKNKHPNSIVGAGVDIVHDRAGTTNFNTSIFNLNVSFLHLMHTYWAMISFFYQPYDLLLFCLWCWSQMNIQKEQRLHNTLICASR